METLTDKYDLVTTGPDIAINTRRIRVNDVELNVVIHGKGSPVLLVHGFPTITLCGAIKFPRSSMLVIA